MIRELQNRDKILLARCQGQDSGWKVTPRLSEEECGLAREAILEDSGHRSRRSARTGLMPASRAWAPLPGKSARVFRARPGKEAGGSSSAKTGAGGRPGSSPESR